MLDEPDPLFSPKERYRPNSPADNLAMLSDIGSTCMTCEGEGCEECLPEDVEAI